MSDLAQRRVRNVVSRLDLWRYRAKARLERLSRAWRYSTGRLTADDAQRVMLDCRDPAGWHPLLVLTVEDTLEQARETFADHPELPQLVADGCARVGDKWESYSDEFYEARRWAIDLAEEYAAAENIALVRLDDDGVATAADPEDDSEGDAR
ncbi:MAG: hypothetical protein WBF43_07240 [Methylocella sp.]